MKPASNIRSTDITFNAAVFHNEIKQPAGHLDAGSCSSRVVFNVPKAHSTGIEAELSVHPLPGLDLSLAGSVQSSKFDSTIADRCRRVPAGIGGQSSADRAEVPDRGNARPMASGSARTRTGTITASVQHIGNRFTQPSRPGPGCRDCRQRDLLRPDRPAPSATGAKRIRLAASFPAYTLVNLRPV